MYQVIKVTSMNEPWWFFEGWRDEIDKLERFEDFERALNFYKVEWHKLSVTYDEYDSRKNLLAAFWNVGEFVWCDACDESLQLFHGLMLLKDYEKLSDEMTNYIYEKRTTQPPEKVCTKKEVNVTYKEIKSDL